MIRYATAADLPAILDIYNDAILNTTAVYDYTPHTLEDRTAWYETKKNAHIPIWVLEEDQLVIGFATFGPFRAWPAYKYTIEHSVYVHKDHRGKRLGTLLLQELIQYAEAKGYATLVAGIDGSNKASLVLHERAGFTNAGTIQKAGYKFGKWLDLVFYQYHLTGPANPTEN